MSRRFHDVRGWARGLVLGALVAALLLAGAPAALAQCPGDAPLTATLQLQDAPTNVTFDPSPAVTPKLKIVLQVENCSGGAVFTTERQLARLFGLRADEVARAVKTLVRAGTVRADCAIDGWPGRWLIHAAAVPAEAHKSPRSEPCRP